MLAEHLVSFCHDNSPVSKDASPTGREFLDEYAVLSEVSINVATRHYTPLMLPCRPRRPGAGDVGRTRQHQHLDRSPLLMLLSRSPRIPTIQHQQLKGSGCSARPYGPWPAAHHLSAANTKVASLVAPTPSVFAGSPLCRRSNDPVRMLQSQEGHLVRDARETNRLGTRRACCRFNPDASHRSRCCATIFRDCSI